MADGRQFDALAAPGQFEERVLVELGYIRREQEKTNAHLEKLNGAVAQNKIDIAVLKVTALRLDAGRIVAILCGVAVIVGGLLKAAGLF